VYKSAFFIYLQNNNCLIENNENGLITSIIKTLKPCWFKQKFKKPIHLNFFISIDLSLKTFYYPLFIRMMAYNFQHFLT